MSAPSRCLITVIIFTIIVIGLLATGSLILGFLIALYSPNNDNNVMEGGGTIMDSTMAPESGGPEEPMVPESEYADQRIWLIHVGEYNHMVAYLDNTDLQPRGFEVDVVNTVCRLSRKRCRLVFDSYAKCYNNGKIGLGLVNGYYHACAGWSITYERLRSAIFTDEHEQASGTFWVTSQGNPSNFDSSDVTGVKVGFINSWNSNPACVNRLLNTRGLPLTGDQAIAYDSIDDLVDALTDGRIGAGFIGESLVDESRMQVVSEEIKRCSAGQLAIMTRPTPAGVEFTKWWNEGLNRLLFSREYSELCDRLETVHGHKEGGGTTEVCLTDYLQ